MLELLSQIEKFIDCPIKNCISKRIKSIDRENKYPKQKEFNQKILQEKGEIKQNQNLKVIVFDVNKTLLIKNK